MLHSLQPVELKRIVESHLGHLRYIDRETLLPHITHDSQGIQPLKCCKSYSYLKKQGYSRETFESELEAILSMSRFRTSIDSKASVELLELMILTRATDNMLKHLFMSAEMQYKGRGVQGKGFRSLGQEAIAGASLAMRYGPNFGSQQGWTGDVIGPLIRDLALMLAFTDDVRLALNAQVGKDAAPMFGRDLHYGDYERGVLPAAAPLSIATTTLVGTAFAFKLKNQARVAFSMIGEGGSSLGEWHEAINCAGVHNLPIVFCIQNNQTALSTPRNGQSRVRSFREKAVGYGLPGVCVDGNDPTWVGAAFHWAAQRARSGQGPSVIELETMRMCGHAHHDDMLYLGEEPKIGFELPVASKSGYANTELYQQWRTQDPIIRFANRLMESGTLRESDIEVMKNRSQARCEDAKNEIARLQWPKESSVCHNVTSHQNVAKRVLELPESSSQGLINPSLSRTIEVAPDFDRSGTTYLDAIAEGLDRVLKSHENAFIMGEDCGAPYGNAFLLLRSLLKEHGDKIYNMPIAEGGILGTLIGAALEGCCAIGEMQFNDFVASGFNQLVNNAAKLRYRTGLSAPCVVRMPWGGLRRAGPYHSQDTSPWFYRTPGLVIVAPSTPYDAWHLIQDAADCDDPVLYYEHIALYRKPSIKQSKPWSRNESMIGKAALRRVGEDLVIISYGAFVHRAIEVADALSTEGYECAVLDLRSLSPLDWDAIDAQVIHNSKVLLVGEDTKKGSILESIGSEISERHYFNLDAPVKVLGSLDTPVPYAPSLEDAFLTSVEEIRQCARNLLRW